ncbi:MAG: TOBE domain-containing protein [Verrucomicrobia bacterium]|nr:TOBE domain-containing protein [Verrucomicrobiota bacterium]
MTFLKLNRTGADSVAVDGINIRLSDPLKAVLRTTDCRDLTLGVRPNDMSIVAPAAEHLDGEVALVQPQGNHAIVAVRTNSGLLTVVVPSDQRSAPGASVGVAFASEELHLFDSCSTSLLYNLEKSGG